MNHHGIGIMGYATRHGFNYVPAIFLTLVLALVFSGCQDNTTTISSAEDVPSALPLGQGMTAEESAARGGLGTAATGRQTDLNMRTYAWTRPDSLPTYYCVSNVFAPEAPDGYITQAIGLEFAPETISQADGVTMTFRYRTYRVSSKNEISGYVPDPKDLLLRAYCQIPATNRARNQLRRSIDQVLANRYHKNYGFVYSKEGATIQEQNSHLKMQKDPVDGGQLGTIVVTAEGPASGGGNSVPPPPDIGGGDEGGSYNGGRYGDDGTGSGDSGPDSEGNPTEEERCASHAKAPSSIISFKINPDDQSPDYGGPSYAPPCEEREYSDTKEIRKFEQDYRDKMTDKEIKIFDEMSRYNQLIYLYNAKEALDKAQDLFSNMSQHNTKADAFRHAYFSMKNVDGLGFPLARKLGDAHEAWTGNPVLEKQMDLYNNKVGREAYSDWISDSNLSGAGFIKKLANDGKLTRIKNGTLVPTN